MLGARQHKAYTVANDDDVFKITSFYFMIFENLTALNINGCDFTGFRFVLYGG
jgi:hypothetical protein